MSGKIFQQGVTFKVGSEGGVGHRQRREAAMFQAQGIESWESLVGLSHNGKPWKNFKLGIDTINYWL